MGSLRFLPLVSLGLILSFNANAGLIIGGFDFTRGGFESIADSSSMSDLRTAIQNQFPGTTFSSSDTLTASYLDTVEVLMLGVATGNFSAITPLTTAEQTALLDFVDAGGEAIIFTDNDSFDPNNADNANNSLVSPFGLSVGGDLTGPNNDGSQSGTYLSGGYTLQATYPGEFTGLGSSTELAYYNAAGQPPAVTYFPSGALAPGSGPAVFFSDSSLMLNGYMTADDQQDIFNALALAPGGSPGNVTGAPEPATWALLLAGLALAPRLKKRAQ